MLAYLDDVNDDATFRLWPTTVTGGGEFQTRERHRAGGGGGEEKGGKYEQNNKTKTPTTPRFLRPGSPSMLKKNLTQERQNRATSRSNQPTTSIAALP